MKQLILLSWVLKAHLVICKWIYDRLTTKPKNNMFLSPGFTISPQDTVQAIGIPAKFQCQYSGARTIGWIFNGTSIHSYDSPANITTDILPGSINVLTVPALPDYNETEIWCVATVFQNGHGRVENSSKGKLIVQGIHVYIIAIQE